MYLLKKVFDLREKAHPDHEKPFLEHLEDLRVMITRVVITLVISMIICFTFRENLMDILREPAEQVLVSKEKETMPDGGKFPGIRVPTIEQWNQAKDIEQIVTGLGEEQRDAFYEKLQKPELEFHAQSVALLRAAKGLPEEVRERFIDALDVKPEMRLQLLALLDSDPSVQANAGANIRMMSALKPTETFMLSMKLAFFAGIVLAFPLLLLFILQFVLPGLHNNEKRVLWPAMAIGFGLFLLGVFFAYWFVLPRALLFFYNWSSGLGVENDWRIGEYITFATQFTLLFGLSFELPVVVMVLVKLGLLTYETMAKTRTYAVVAIYITAALITPTPDIMTLNLMALPMLLLYEICIWLAWFDRKRNRETLEKEEAERKKRHEQWLLLQQQREEEEGYHGEHDHPEMVDEHGDDGWHDEYEHGHYYDSDEDSGHDPHHHDSYEEDHAHYKEHLEEDETWDQPDDAIVGDGEDETKPPVEPSKDTENSEDDDETKKS
ncbi:MAG: twin-arginine translocase subunit TatC [Akkermansiaceae bacterium]